MSEKVQKFVLLAIGVLAMSILVSYLGFAWTEPSQNPPQGNVPTPLNVGPEPQIKEGGLWIASNPTLTTGLIVQYGNVGIGTTTPAYKLDVAGAIRLQPSSVPAGANGVIYYDSSLNKFRCYQAGAWTDCFGSGGGYWAATGTNIYNTNSGNVGIGTIDPQGKLTVFENSRYYYVNRRIGGYNYTEDSQGPNYILLHKAYDGTLMADYRVFGTISAIRGGTGAWNRKFNCEVNTATAYDRTRGSVICKNEGARLVTLRYGGVKYLAIEIANSSTLYNLQFTGWAYAPDGELLKLVYDQDVTEVTDFTGFDAITMQGGAHVINISVDTNTNMFNANHAGYKISHDTDYGGLTLLNLGSNRKDTVLFWGDDANDNLRFMFADSADSHRLKDRMIITGDGKVGIGTTAPEAKLNIPYQGSGNTLMIGALANTGGNNFELTISMPSGATHWPFGITLGGSRVAAFDAGGNLRVDATGNSYFMGNVGIGTRAPNARLQVSGGHISIDGERFLTMNPNDVFTYDGKTMAHYGLGWFGDSWFSGGPTAWFTAWGGIKLFTAGTPRMSITNGGNVGIGTTAPGAKLHVEGGWLRVSNAGLANSAIQLEPQSGFHRIAFNQLRFWDWDTGGDMVTFENGNVGIGTTAPSYRLHVQGGDIYSSGYVRGGTGLCIGSDCRTSWPSGGVGSCADCDSRFVNQSGDTMTGSLSVPIIYDTDNPDFYVDPGSTTRLSRLWLNNAHCVTLYCGPYTCGGGNVCEGSCYCPYDYGIMMSGGCRTADAGAYLYSSRPDDTGTAWKCGVQNTAPADRNFWVYVLCCFR